MHCQPLRNMITLLLNMHPLSICAQGWHMVKQDTLENQS